MIKINLVVHYPNIFLGIKAVLMSLLCFSMVLNQNIFVKVVCILLYLALVHIDIKIIDMDNDIDESEYKDV